jgi:hypothetical protein
LIVLENFFLVCFQEVSRRFNTTRQVFDFAEEIKSSFEINDLVGAVQVMDEVPVVVGGRAGKLVQDGGEGQNGLTLNLL